MMKNRSKNEQGEVRIARRQGGTAKPLFPLDAKCSPALLERGRDGREKEREERGGPVHYPSRERGTGVSPQSAAPVEVERSAVVGLRAGTQPASWRVSRNVRSRQPRRAFFSNKNTG